MEKGKLREQLSENLLGISEKCVAGALAAAGVVAIGQIASISTAAPADAALSAAPAAAEPASVPAGGVAILLDVMQIDPATGEQTAMHYSHASHASHASHYSSSPTYP